MDTQIGHTLIRWSVRLAIICYLGRVFLDSRWGRSRRPVARSARKARWLWTAGCAFYLLHVLCAFTFVHGWSHSSAYRHTAEQTAAVIGIRWGGGLYANYAFTVFWLIDVTVWWLRDAEFPYRCPMYFYTLHAVFAFMVLNATVVFGPSLWKWAALGICMALGIAYCRGLLANGPTQPIRDDEREN